MPKLVLPPVKRRLVLPSKVGPAPATRAPLVGEFVIEGFPISTPGNKVAFDTEGTGLDPWGKLGVDRAIGPARPFAISFCNTDGDTAYMRWKVDPATRATHMNREQKDILTRLLGDAKVAKICHNSTYDRRMMRAMGVPVAGPIHDTILGMHTINPDERSFGLKPLSVKYLGIPADDQTALKASVLAIRRRVQAARRAVAKGKPTGDIYELYTLAEDTEADYWLGDAELCKVYAVLDAKRTMTLHLAQMAELATDGDLMSVYRREVRLLEVIEAMEERGTRVDTARLNEVMKYYDTIIAKAKLEIAAETSVDFNPNSPKQMTAEFFGNRGYKPLAYSYNKEKDEWTKCQHCKGHGCPICQDTGRNPKCDADFLQGIAIDHDDDDNIIVKDKLAHALLYHSAADTMLAYAKNYDAFKEKTPAGHILHPNYRQVGTITGRMSCTKPNLQNVASDESGKKRVDVAYRLREVFVPRNGYVFYLPDYSQIEVWLLFLRAHATEPIRALAAGGDAHQIVANLIWGHTYDLALAKTCAEKDPKTLTAKESANLKQYKKSRKLAKNLQFCKIYGGGLKKIASMIGCTTKEAQVFITDYDKRLPDVGRFMDETSTRAKREGYCRNAYGRRYPIDRKFAYRATNYDIQGSAADLIKQAMINVYDLQQAPRYREKMHLLLSIHDELEIEVHKSIDDMRTKRDIAEAMGRDYAFLGSPIPFPIGMKVATERWSESTEIKI